MKEAEPGESRPDTRSEAGESPAPAREDTPVAEVTATPVDEFAAAPGATAGGFAARRPVAVGVVFLAAVLFGWLSYFNLPVNLMPEMTYPTLTVRTEYPGAAPEEVENEVSRPIEEVLGVIGGLERISSISRAGVSDVVLEFQWDIKVADAVQDTLERLDQVVLPVETERPLVLRFDPSLDPVIELSLTGEEARFQGEEGRRRLRRLAEREVKRALEPIKGVAAVQVRGGLEEEIHVKLDRSALARVGLSSRQVMARLAEENVNVAGGTLEEGSVEYMVRTLNEYRDLDEISDTVVSSFEGRPVRLGDLGQVVRSHKERQILTRADGGESVALDLYKEGDANMVALSKRVREALGELPERGAEKKADEKKKESEREGPRRSGDQGIAPALLEGEGARLEIAADRSVFIERSIREVRDNAIFGGLLAVLVLYLFLRSVRSTAIVAVAIPASLLVTFAPLGMLGVSLNIMSLGGLALGVGMLVDCSIVVLESIHRCREEGDTLYEAVERGTREVRSAVIASTLTTVAVFLPMIFVEGVAGQAFGDLALAVVLSLLASLAVALFLIPMLAARGGGGGLGLATVRPSLRLASWTALTADWRRLGGWRRVLLAPLLALRTLLWLPAEVAGKLVGAILLAVVLGVGGGVGWLVRIASRALDRGPGAWVAAGLERLSAAYRVLVGRALEAPGRVIAGLVAALALTVAGFFALDSELLPEVHQGEMTLELALPPGTPLERTIELLEPIEGALVEDSEHVERVLATYGFDPALSQRSDEGEHTARLRILLTAANAAAEREVAERVRARLAALPDLEHRLTRPVLFSFRTPIEVEIHGENLDLLKAKAAEVERALGAVPELADVSSTLRTGAPEVEIVYDRERLALYGLNVGTVAESVRDLVRGAEATRFNLKDRRIPIVVQLAEEDRRTVEDVRDLVINPGGERPIPLAAIADVRLGEGPSEVRRVDGRRVALVRANLAPGVALGTAVAALESTLDGAVRWPAEMTYFVSGQNEEWQRSAGSLYLALGLSIFLVYVIMAAQFESLLHPFVILFTIPLAFFGSVLALFALGISLSIVVFLGMILLAGIVVNNAIVLVDYVNVLRARGLERREAIVTAGVVRLRPILMTTGTTVLGLLPMALGFGDGAELRTPMAITVIAGLAVSTVLTLIVIPVVYDQLEAAVERGRDRLAQAVGDGSLGAAEREGSAL